MNQRDNERAATDPEPAATSSAPARKPWETPTMEELAVQLSALNPFRGSDGQVNVDCTRSS